MTTLREAAQQALEAMESVEWYGAGSGWMVDADAIEKAITALKAALEEPAQAPVAWMWEETAPRSSTGIGGIDRKLLFCRPADEPWKRNITPLYTAPPQRKPLTDKEIDALRQGAERLTFVTLREFRIIARAIERAHGIGGTNESA